MIIAMRAHATKPDATPKLICLMMSGRGRCPHLRRPDKRGSTVLEEMSIVRDFLGNFS